MGFFLLFCVSRVSCDEHSSRQWLPVPITQFPRLPRCGQAHLICIPTRLPPTGPPTGRNCPSTPSVNISTKDKGSFFKKPDHSVIITHKKVITISYYHQTSNECLDFPSRLVNCFFLFFSHSEFIRIRNQIRSRRCDWLACLSHLFQTAGSVPFPLSPPPFFVLDEETGSFVPYPFPRSVFPDCIPEVSTVPPPWRSVNLLSDLELWSDSDPVLFFFSGQACPEGRGRAGSRHVPVPEAGF